MLKETAVAKFPGMWQHCGLCPLALCCFGCLFVSFSADKRDVVCYTSVSGFIFLRFFAPAILNPRLFHLRPEFPVSDSGPLCILKMPRSVCGVT